MKSEIFSSLLKGLYQHQFEEIVTLADETRNKILDQLSEFRRTQVNNTEVRQTIYIV